MGVVRKFGLIFFLTILIGGCVVAVNTSPPSGFPTEQFSEIEWERAMELLNQGQVVRMTPALDLRVYMVLANGTRVATRAPTFTAINEATSLCGMVCGGLETGSV